MQRREMLSLCAAAIMLLGRAGSGWAITPPRRKSIWVDTLAIGRPTVDPLPLLKGGMDAAVVDMAIYPRGRAEAEQALEQWAAVESAPDSSFKIVRKRADFEAAVAEGKFGIVLACQDASILGPSVFSVNDSNLETLAAYHEAGLRVLQLAHNERNSVADGFRERVDAGLSRLGEAVVVEMNRLGMLVDLSHCSDLTAFEAIRLSRKPVAITHAGCRALHPSKRNKTDEVIRAIGNSGGFFGVYMMSRWLTQRATSSVEDVVDHIDHVVRIAGIEAAGFGSDQALLGDTRPQNKKVSGLSGYQDRNRDLPGGDPLFGHITPADMDGPDRMEVLAAALTRRGYKDAAQEKILGGNFLRVFGEACG